jgi:hypothetical protein
MGVFVFLINLALIAAAVYFGKKYYKKFKGQKSNAFTEYYTQKRQQFPWLDRWLSDWQSQNIDPVQIRANRLFGKNPAEEYSDEYGLTLECPSCRCPHSWVMTAKDNIVENKETTTETIYRSGYGKGDFFDSVSEGFKKNGKEEKVKVVYTGRAIRDFKCLNCGHTERNEYNERWVNYEPDTGFREFNPPVTAWEIPQGYVNQAASALYEQAKTAGRSTEPPAAPSAQQTTPAVANIAGINPSLLKAAELGNVEAQGDLADMYLLGNGVRKDMGEAEKWLRKIWEADTSRDDYYDDDTEWHSDLIANEIKDRGISASVANKYALAVQLYQMAAEMGNADAHYYLGGCYELGNGVPKDKEKARSWYQKAADMGYSDAKKALRELK